MELTTLVWHPSEEPVNCPMCGRQIENELVTLCSYWVQSSTCEGPPLKRPDGVWNFPGDNWRIFARTVRLASDVFILHNSIRAADNLKPDVVLFLETVQKEVSGSNPWLSADNTKYIYCPAYEKETYNSLDSFLDYCTMNAQCPGSMMVTIQRWRELDVDVSELVDHDRFESASNTKVCEVVPADELRAMPNLPADTEERKSSDSGSAVKTISYCLHCGTNLEVSKHQATATPAEQI